MTVCPTYKPPFPYFGGKARAAELVWASLGTDAGTYVEPFFGSGAVLFRRPQPFAGTETVNDADGLLANFWRALQADPDAVAHYAAWPVNENDLSARHAWLVERKERLQAWLEGDPDYHDAKIAGWWVWGLSCWIGNGWCSGKGPWRVCEVDGAKVLAKTGGDAGVHRKLPHLGGAGKGVHRQLPHLGDAGKGVHRQRQVLREYLGALAGRLRGVRVCCGDWSRLVTPAVLDGGLRTGPIAVFLDPPYADTARRDSRLYRVDCESVAHAVRDWAIAQGDNPRMRIALCGYEGEHVMPDTWECVAGKGGRGHGYGGQKRGGYANAKRERIWFSPHCLRPAAIDDHPLLRMAE